MDCVQNYDPITGELWLGRPQTGLTAAFHVDRQRDKIEEWLAEYFGKPVFFRRNSEVGFPDDLDSPGPTVISTSPLLPKWPVGCRRWMFGRCACDFDPTWRSAASRRSGRIGFTAPNRSAWRFRSAT
jgi:hypothetical protein